MLTTTESSITKYTEKITELLMMLISVVDWDLWLATLVEANASHENLTVIRVKIVRNFDQIVHKMVNVFF